MKLSQAINEFRDWRGFKVTNHTVIRYDRNLRVFCLCFHDPNVEDVRVNQIIEYLQSKEKLGWQRNGIIIDCLALRTFFEFCNMRGYRCIDERLIPLPRKEFNIPRIANEKDFNKLLSVIPKDNNVYHIRNLALLNLIKDSMARVGEILSLDEDDLKFDKDMSGSATIRTEKSRGKRPIREIFWKPQTGKHLKKWIKRKHEFQEHFVFSEPDALFISIGRCVKIKTRGNRMRPHNAAEVFRKLSNSAGLGYVANAHSVRHLGARDIIEKGGDVTDVANLLGHSHVESSFIYTMLNGNDLRKRWDKFNRKQKGRVQPERQFHGGFSREYGRKR